MKALIVSDTHGSHRNLERVIEKEQPLDLLIHLGDVEGGEDYIEAIADCPVHVVAGNNDFFSELPREEEFFVGGSHIFITHGHYYYVSMNENRLKEEAKGRGVDIAMYGHTHVPYLEEDPDDITILNPGSISKPRQADHRYTYMVMEIDDEDEVTYELRYVE